MKIEVYKIILYCTGKNRTDSEYIEEKMQRYFVEDLCKEETDINFKRQLFLQIFEILYEQGLLQEDEKNRMRVMLTRMPDKVGGYCGTGSHL